MANVNPSYTFVKAACVFSSCSSLCYFFAAEDPDGDAVRCRWAEQYSGECGGICGHDPDMALNPVGLCLSCLHQIKASQPGP